MTGQQTMDPEQFNHENIDKSKKSVLMVQPHGKTGENYIDKMETTHSYQLDYDDYQLNIRCIDGSTTSDSTINLDSPQVSQQQISNVCGDRTVTGINFE